MNMARNASLSPRPGPPRAGSCAENLAGLPVEMHTDAAGNLWATLPGESERALLIGGHLDSVPNGGWLDGCLNVLAGVEILRRMHAQYDGRPPVTVRLVDWADEEGARFGKSLFGSSACSGNLDMDEARGLRDRDGVRLPDALREHGIDFERVKDSGRELANAAAYLELHIEQGPVLLDLDLPLGTVLGTFGVERHAITFHGQAAHSGSTPMNRRSDAFLAAAKMAAGDLPHRGTARRRLHHRLVHDEAGHRHQRRRGMPDHARPAPPRRRRARADAAGGARGQRAVRARRATSRCLGAHLEHRAESCFIPNCSRFCDEAIAETGAPVHRLPSGPLHDAAEVARAGVPTVMMFVQSLHGISHNKIEDTREEHLEMAVAAFDRTRADKTLALDRRLRLAASCRAQRK